MAPTTAPAKEWLSMHEASSLVGSSPATLRRWSDAGELVTFTTPGGHRRFARASLLSMLPPGPRERAAFGRLDGTSEHLARLCRRNLPKVRGEMSWIDQIDGAERTALRDFGWIIASSLIAGLDASTAPRREIAFEQACSAASDCGRIAARHGIGTTVSVTVVLSFRKLFLADLVEVLRRHRVDSVEVTDLVLTATSTFDKILLAMLSGYAGLANPMEDSR